MQHYKYYVTIADRLWQDSVCLIAPYPNNPKPADQFDFATDMDLSGKGLLWCARPQLFFHCSVVPSASDSFRVPLAVSATLAGTDSLFWFSSAR